MYGNRAFLNYRYLLSLTYTDKGSVMPPVTAVEKNPSTLFGPYYPMPRPERATFFRRHFGIPEIFWASMQRKACGYFSCQDLYENNAQVGHGMCYI